MQLKLYPCVFLLLAASIVFLGCGPKAASKPKGNDADLLVVDEYLEAWTFLVRMPTAEDARKMAGKLKERQPDFEKSMIRLLDEGDERGAGRLVYSQVVQVGSFLDIKSQLGKAAQQLVGDDCPVSELDGDRLFFAGDLYLWWKRHSVKFPSYKPLLEWESSGLARETVIPMYEARAKEFRINTPPR